MSAPISDKKYVHQVFAYEIQSDESRIPTPTWFASFACRKEALNYIDNYQVEYEDRFQHFFVQTIVLDELPEGVFSAHYFGLFVTVSEY